MAVTFPLYYSFATAAKPVPAPQCGFWDLPCKLGQAGKFITDSALGQANAEQVNFNQKVSKPVTDTVLGEANDIQTRFKKGTDKTKADLKHIRDSILGEGNAIQGAGNAIQQDFWKGLGNFGAGFPIGLALTGGAVLLIALLVIRR